VPFMKRITRFSPIASVIAWRMGLSVCSDIGLLRRSWSSR
jgi:hypothetical protein